MCDHGNWYDEALRTLAASSQDELCLRHASMSYVPTKVHSSSYTDAECGCDCGCNCGCNRCSECGCGCR